MLTGEKIAAAALRNLEPTLDTLIAVCSREPRAAIQLTYLIGIKHGAQLELVEGEITALEETILSLKSGSEQ